MKLLKPVRAGLLIFKWLYFLEFLFQFPEKFRSKKYPFTIFFVEQEVLEISFFYIEVNILKISSTAV